MPDLEPHESVIGFCAEHIDWVRGEDALTRSVTLPTFPDVIMLVNRIAEAAEQRDHHPDIDIRWRTVTFTLSTHSAGGVTSLDLGLARQNDAIVERGADER